MARKVFSDDEDETEATGAVESAVQRPRPLERRTSMARGGASADKYILNAAQGGASRTYQEISVSQIQDSPIADRIDLEEDIDVLVESIEKDGQKIPIIVRMCNGDRPYEIVAGRRRLRAVQRLGHLTINAFVTKMSDEEALLTQGIENNQRQDNSFIERARTASRILEHGHSQEVLGRFMGIDRSLISLMINIYKEAGEDLVMAIGPARGIGRRKWETLIDLVRQSGVSRGKIIKMIDKTLSSSAERFDDLVQKLAETVSKPDAPEPEDTASRTPKVKRTLSGRRIQRFLNGSISLSRSERSVTFQTKEDIPIEVMDEVEELVRDRIRKYEEEISKST